MKILLLGIFTTAALCTQAQDKYHSIHFNKLTEVAGTEYVIASVEHWGKLLENNDRYLLFISTKTGDTTQVNFPDGADIDKIEPVKIDSLGINLILIAGKIVDLDNKGGIDWDDPMQLVLLSPDGKQKIQLTENRYFVRTWVINKLTGTITITGHWDTNNTGQYEKADKHEIQIFDLKTLKLISRI